MRFEITLKGWQLGLYLLDGYYQYKRIIFFRLAYDTSSNDVPCHGEVGIFGFNHVWG